MTGLFQALISWLLFGLCGRFVMTHCPLNSFSAIIPSDPRAPPQLRCVRQRKKSCSTLIHFMCVCVYACVREKEKESVFVADSWVFLKWLCALKSTWRGYKPQTELDQSGLSLTKTQSSPGNGFCVHSPGERGTLCECYIWKLMS